jgi:hypothetical protein
MVSVRAFVVTVTDANDERLDPSLGKALVYLIDIYCDPSAAMIDDTTPLEPAGDHEAFTATA